MCMTFHELKNILNGNFCPKNEKIKPVEEENENRTAYKFKLHLEYPFAVERYVSGRRLKVIPGLIEPIIPDRNRSHEDKDSKELYALCALILFKPFKSRWDFMEDYSCFHDSFESFKKYHFLLSGMGPKILDKMQEFCESKERSAIPRADRYLRETEQRIVENEDGMKAVQKEEFLLDFENDEKASFSTDDDMKSRKTDKSDTNDECIDEDNGSEVKWDSETFKLVLKPMVEKIIKKKLMSIV